MPFGSLVTTLRADLKQLDRDLAEGIRRYEKFNREAQRLAVVRARGLGLGVGLGGGGGGGARYMGGAAPAAGGAAGGPGSLISDRDIANVQRAVNALNKGMVDSAKQRAREENAIRLTQHAQRKKLAQEEVNDAKRLAREEFAIRETQRLHREKQAKDAAKARKEEERRNIAAQKEFARLQEKADRQARQYQRDQEREARRAAAEQRRNTGYGITDATDRLRGMGLTPAIVPAAERGSEAHLQRLQAQLQQANSLSGRLSRTLQQIGQRDLRAAAEMASNFADRLRMIGTAAILGGIVQYIRKGYELNRQYERYRLTLSTILGLTNDVVDSSGKIVSQARAIPFVRQQSEALFKSIRDEADKTILETDELLQVFSENLGNAVRAGLSIDQAKTLVSQIAQLAKTQGLMGGVRQLSQEVRAVLTGGQSLQSGTVAKILGLDDKTIQAARTAGNLFEVVMDRLQGGLPYIREFEQSSEAIFSTLVSRGKDFIRLSFAETFNRITGGLAKMRTELTSAKVEEYAKRVGAFFEGIYDTIQDVGESRGFQSFKSFFTFLARNADKLIAIFVAARALNALNAGVMGLGGAGGLLAGTTAGAAAQGGIPGLIRRFGPGAAAAIGAGGALVGLTGGAAAGALLGLQGQTNAADAMARRSGRQLERFEARNPGAGAIRRARENLSIRLRQEMEARNAFREAGLANPTADQRIMMPVEPGGPAVRRNLQSFVAQTQQAREALSLANRLYRPFGDGGGDLSFRARRSPAEQLADDKERIEVARKLADLRGDQIAGLRAEAEAAKMAANEDIKSAERRATMIRAIEENLAEEITKIRLNQEITVNRQLADLTNDRIGQINAETQAAIMAAYDEIKNEKDRARVIDALRRDSARKRREARFQERMGVEETIAGATGNEAMAARLAAGRSLFELESVDTRLVSPERVAAARRAIMERLNRTEYEARRDLNTRLRDLNERATESVRDNADKQRRIQNDMAELERRTQRERREHLKQRIDAERDLTRTLEDQQRVQEDLNLSASQRATRNAARGLLRNNLRFAEGVSSGRQERFIREIAGRVASGDDIGSIMETLRGQGFGGLGEVFTSNLADLAEGGVNNELRGQNLQEGREVADDQRRREEAQRAVDEQRARLEELNERQREMHEALRQSAAELRDNWNNALRDGARAVHSLAEEIFNLLRESARSGYSVTPENLMAANNFLQQAGGGTAGAARAIQAAGGTHSFQINVNGVPLGGNDENARNLMRQMWPLFHEFLQEEARRTAPTR